MESDPFVIIEAQKVKISGSEKQLNSVSIPKMSTLTMSKSSSSFSQQRICPNLRRPLIFQTPVL